MTEHQNTLRQRLQALDTPSIADAMDSLGLYGPLPGIVSRAPGQHTIAGPAFTVRYQSFERQAGEFHNAGNYIDEVAAGEVILVDNQGRADCTVWGDILTEMALRKGIAGTLIHGAARDIGEIQRQGYPLFSAAVFMYSGKNRVRLSEKRVALQIGPTEVQPGDWIVADSSGALAIPAAQVEEVLQRAERIDATERKIRAALRDGVPLEQARAAYRYDRPWEEATPA
ncbi:RraA family protein [Chromobacterium amazonense]|uniref:Putative 4-hydroxy-4-methyl-2-oxoglutarate aldolase n=1 Tax=Chromobacterium amazonense TaxID=1382803 RepID=A0ABU8V2E6_9NEIS|nr:RraA family protein [Chromobacterium amazonense]MDE1713463.1 RraA family protein [Chromobacterium amazonense]MDQ4540067.1 RraA family protein [Chromobacterium amazonense]